ncbi:major outer membrane protein [Arcobacter cryaerophilus gv. pseudocryaerophilus]|uniref:Major outer membrane protein n=3 Tax=unclassified Arcobacter TaxID=2593671 RepID=A0AA96RAS5_9BACT|nr:major outer membrane protein [Arcobacter sp. AZ-2023]WPD06305.1 major outer membrane protein [Arcobacter sp. DSM 115956]WPD08396.1 major outer membrane protein [Arcobacter sp. DSM 115955]WNL32661.1 major outer membrane protein [Arcobacter sp. AZ-2023]WNP38811.1 major outer membrane protein [Arcobacter sp. AZ-2023]
MRKISKISLVAAVAVAGFSTANAQPLEEAIKNVDVSGSVVYRYNNYDNNGVDPKGAQTENNNYKVGLNLSSKVNDYVKFNSRFLVGTKTDFASLGSKKDGAGDTEANVTLSNAYFGFTAIPNTVVNIGKQGLTTPYTVAVDINGNEQNGTGILALSTFGPITAGAGYFNATNLGDSGNGNPARTAGLLKNGYDMYVATVQGDLDFVKLEAWYAGMQNTFGSYTLAATSKFDLAESAKLGLEARYVNLDLNSRIATGDDAKNSMFRFAADGKFYIVNARLAYTMTDKHGGLTALDQDAKNTSLGWFITSNGVADADYFQAALGADILDNLNFTANYGYLKSDENADDLKQQEVYGQLTYKMSKNLTTYLRYGQFEEKTVSTGSKDIDQNAGRLQVAYTF